MLGVLSKWLLRAAEHKDDDDKEGDERGEKEEAQHGRPCGRKARWQVSQPWDVERLPGAKMFVAEKGSSQEQA